MSLLFLFEILDNIIVVFTLVKVMIVPIKKFQAWNGGLLYAILS